MKRQLQGHRKLLVIGVFLALCLAVLVPAATMAGSAGTEEATATKSFNAVLTPSAMDATKIAPFPNYPWPKRETADTNVWPIVDVYLPNTPVTGWIVNGRSIYGNTTGDASGPFTFTYGGIVDVMQSGSIQGAVVIQTAQGTLYVTAVGGSKTKIIDVYTTQPTIIPKTLSAEFSGLYAMEAGTGIYSKLKGVGRFYPYAGKPLILHLSPDQHVLSIEGSIKMSGSYSY